jgi:hypothetical protein
MTAAGQKLTSTVHPLLAQSGHPINVRCQLSANNASHGYNQDHSEAASMRSQFTLIAIHFISSGSSKVFPVMIAPASIMSAWLGLVRIPPAAMPAGRRLHPGAGLESDRQIGVGVCRAQSLQVWHWMRLPMGTTPIARMTQSIRRAKRVINQFLECGCNTSPFVLGLLH